MNKLENTVALFPNGSDQLELIPTAFSFLLCIVMAFIIREFYIRRSFSLTGKNHIGAILPVLSAVIFLVIIVVKSSLALSLGLVGALSIVRFRTPIKEPEELVYLFLAIAVGIGYGAGQVLVTTLCTVVILAIVYFWLSNRKTGQSEEYNMVINWKSPDTEFSTMLDSIKDCAKTLRIVRIDYAGETSTAVLLVVLNDNEEPDKVLKLLREKDKTATCSFFEAKTNW